MSLFSFVVGDAQYASQVPSGDQLTASRLVKSSRTTSVAFFVAVSMTHSWEKSCVRSNTCASSPHLRLASSSLKSASVARYLFTILRPSKVRDSLTSRLQLICLAAAQRQNPDLILHILVGASCSRKAMCRPSDHQVGAYSPRSPKVSCHDSSPELGTIQM